MLAGDETVGQPGPANHGKGTVLEELVRRFTEESNEADNHWTGPNAVWLMAQAFYLPSATSSSRALFSSTKALVAPA